MISPLKVRLVMEDDTPRNKRPLQRQGNTDDPEAGKLSSPQVAFLSAPNGIDTFLSQQKNIDKEGDGLMGDISGTVNSLLNSEGGEEVTDIFDDTIVDNQGTTGFDDDLEDLFGEDGTEGKNKKPQGNTHEEEFIPFGDDKIDQTILSLGLVDFIITFSIEHNDQGLSPTQRPLKGSFIQVVYTTFLLRYGIDLKEDARFFKILSSTKHLSPWRAHLRLMKTDNIQKIISEMEAESLEVPYKANAYRPKVVNFRLQINPVKASAYMSDYIGFQVKWPLSMQLTASCFQDMVRDFDVRIPDDSPKIFEKRDDNKTVSTDNWIVMRSSTAGFDPRSNMKVKVKDQAAIFMIPKSLLQQELGGINPTYIAPPYVIMSVLYEGEAIHYKANVDIMGYGYCLGSRVTHMKSQMYSTSVEYMPREECLFCMKEEKEDGRLGGFLYINKCRNILCETTFGVKKVDRERYENERLLYDCIVTERQLIGQLLNYCRPALPAVQKKMVNMSTPKEMAVHKPQLAAHLANMEAMRERVKQARARQERAVPMASPSSTPEPKRSKPNTPRDD